MRNSDGTVVFAFSKQPTGGSLKTVGFAKKHGKPCLHISRGCYDPAIRTQKFVKEHDIKTPNVAVLRESKNPGMYQWVKRVPADVFFWADDRYCHSEVREREGHQLSHPVKRLFPALDSGKSKVVRA